MEVILTYLNNLSQRNTFIVTVLIIVAFISFNISVRVIIQNMYDNCNSIEVSKKINRTYFRYIYTIISLIIIILNMTLLSINFDSLTIGAIITIIEYGVLTIITYLLFKNMSVEIDVDEEKKMIFGVIGILTEFIG